MHLLDANVLITAGQRFYQLDRVPHFWSWLLDCGQTDRLKLPTQMVTEITAGRDAVADWLRQDRCRTALTLDEEPDAELVQDVLRRGYGENLDALELETVGQDPFLIAYAAAAPRQRCVVTVEVSRPKARRANRRIPDVCETLGIRCIDIFALVEELDFRIA